MSNEQTAQERIKELKVENKRLKESLRILTAYYKADRQDLVKKLDSYKTWERDFIEAGGEL